MKITAIYASSPYGYCTDCGCALDSNYREALCSECWEERH